MDKVQLGTRIPKNLDLDIESRAKTYSVTKQDMVVTLLQLGLAFSKEPEEFRKRLVTIQAHASDKKSKSIASTSESAPGNDLSTNELLIPENLEERLIDLETVSGNLSSQLAKLEEVLKNLSSANNQPCSSSICTTGQTQKENALTPPSVQEDIQELTEEHIQPLVVHNLSPSLHQNSSVSPQFDITQEQDDLLTWTNFVEQAPVLLNPDEEASWIQSQDTEAALSNKVVSDRAATPLDSQMQINHSAELSGKAERSRSRRRRRYSAFS